MLKHKEPGHGNAATGAKTPEKEKERVTIHKAPVYNDEHLATIREALELLGLHYEVSTNRAQVYQPISIGGLWNSNKFNIKIQQEREKQLNILHLDGGCPHCGENEFAYNENKLHCTHCEKSPLDEPEGKGRPHSDGEPAEGIATYRTTDCIICGSAPDYIHKSPNYFSKGSWFCEPHYIEMREGKEADPFADQCSFCDSGKPAEQIDIDGKKACEDCKEPTPDPEENMTGYLKRKFTEAGARKLEETIMNVNAFSGSAPEISQDEKGPHLVCEIEGCRDEATHEATPGRQIFKFLCEYHANSYHPKAYRPLEPAEEQRAKDDAADTLAHSVKKIQELANVTEEEAKELINRAKDAGKEQEKSDLKGLAAYHSGSVPENKEKQLDPDYLAYLNDPLQDPRD